MTKTTTLSRVALVLAALVAATFGVAHAASRAKIDRRVNETLEEFRYHVRGGSEVLSRARGVLVFPSIKKGGFGVGGEYGQGALRVGGRTVGYYSEAGASVGFQIGFQARSQIFVFLDQSALEHFRHSDNWKVGVDGSVTVIAVGAGATVDSQTLNKPVVAFIFDGKGLMYNLSLEGTKITRLHK